MLRYLSAGESHGKALLAILDGMPAGLKVDLSKINQELARRQSGFGRGQRMKIEKDRSQILAGLRGERTLGSPIALLIENKDSGIDKLKKVICPRPGHADLAGLLQYGVNDARDVLERASARSTAITVAIGALCKIFLDEFRIRIISKVVSVGGEIAPGDMSRKIKQAIAAQDTIGGVFQMIASGVPAGLGSYAQWDKRLDTSLSAGIMSIPGVKAVGVGLGFGYALRFGSQCHDPIYYNKNRGFFRKTNNAGGIEGGISNGEDIVLFACMKPISTLGRPLDSVNIATKRPAKGAIERSDTCVVESAGVVAEAVCAYALSGVLLDKFGSDSMPDIKNNYKHYLRRIKIS